ncbi:hypothetical protein [Pseudoalteromonas sp. BDTF-M6]|uniref:hypothetical protein n=1 Tax=Pseudoalteromonas sp. BDTF-M6 TaxID=2796132 RepID=UPI001BAF5A01|nr:hypothetical protein [Pseudoalteromonas sp. BDTF-M6]MBS3798631.1 hypothetical protein [Pseudoalteromonas sp. BDTF-M6]
MERIKPAVAGAQVDKENITHTILSALSYTKRRQNYSTQIPFTIAESVTNS